MFATKQRFGLGRVYLHATAEARRRGDRRIGSDHIALALLADPESVTARALGVDLAAARVAVQALDRAALAAVGIQADCVEPVVTGWRNERLPLSPAAKALFTGLRTRARGEPLGIQHVLLALLDRPRPDPAAELLDALGVNRAEVRRRLRDC